MKAIFEFGKLGRLRYISHLDLQRFMQRALRRSNLPVAYSQGFTPHALISFASALAMGWSSEGELLDVKLSAPVEAEATLEALRSALPPDMPVYGVCLVEDRFPAVAARLVWVDYRIALPGPEGALVRAEAARFMDETHVSALRKTKSGERETDIRPMAASLTAEADVLCARLMLTEPATLKPDLLLNVLAARAGIPTPDARIHRMRLLCEEGDRVLPLMELAAQNQAVNGKT